MSAIDDSAKRLISVAQQVSLQGRVVGDRIILSQNGNTFELKMFQSTTISDRGVINR